MKILLVYPEYPATFWSFTYALKFVHKKANLPPLGILTVAALLPQDWEMQLVDMNVDKLRDSQIAWADLVMVSAMNIQQDSAVKVIERSHELGKPVACGGPLFSTEPEKFDQADYLLLYEGETCIPQFVRDWQAGHPRHIYNEQSFPRLTETPIPRWDLLDAKKYAMLSLQFSRGCPFNCDFCNVVSLFGHSPRTKSVPQVLSELDAIYVRGWRGGVFFVDDNFIGNKKLLKNEVLPAMIEWSKAHGYPFGFFTEVSINLADDEELMDLMARAGFDNVFVGIETVDEDCLVECNKSQNEKRDLTACVHTIQHHGMQVQGGFILGFDNDKPTIFNRMFEFIQQSGVVTAMVGLLTAPPGTKLFERLKGEGRIVDEFSGVNTSTDMNFVPKMDEKQLMHGYTSVVHGIYSPKQYYQRVRTFLEHYKPAGLHKSRLTFTDVKAFLKACWLLGVVSKGRTHYWGLLHWTRKNKPELFGRAVAFSIYGYHFRKCLPELQ